MNGRHARLLALFFLTGSLGLADSLKICHVSSELGSVLPRANDSSATHGGFKVAIQAYNRRHKKSVKFTVADGKSLLDQLNWAAAGNCDAIVGLVTSRDALLAAPILKKNGTLVAFSSTATADELNDYFPNVISASTSMSAWVEAVERKFKNQRYPTVIIVSKPDDLYSLFFTKKLASSFGSGTVILNLGPNDEIKSSFIKTLDPASQILFLYSTYPIHSLHSLAQLAGKLNKSKSAHWKIVGTQSWIETHTFRARKDVMDQLPICFHFSPWIAPANSAYRLFKAQYHHLYQRPPDHDSTYDYDVMNMILNCYQESQVKNGFEKLRLRDCLGKQHEYLGATGLYRYNGIQSHPIRNEQIVPLHLKRLNPVE